VSGFAALTRARHEGNFGHAWLLAGPRGIGKSNLAHVLATHLVDASLPEPGMLAAESAIEARESAMEPATRHPDLHVLMPATDKRTISVEQVRDAIADLALTSLSGVGKVLIIEPAESMTLAAANALLKTLEEPTANTYFLLVSHQPGFLPATVRSRCQLYPVPVPPVAAAAEWLAAGRGSASRADLESLLAVSGGRPLLAAERAYRGNINLNSELSAIFDKLADNDGAAQKSIQGWLKDDPETLLDWLATRLEWAIKARLAADAWTPVTDLDVDRLHNTWRKLTLVSLFEGHAEALALRRQIGSGTNLELGLRVLVEGITPGAANCE
jgi:DNA polymerase-3 subunit delta'